MISVENWLAPQRPKTFRARLIFLRRKSSENQEATDHGGFQLDFPVNADIMSDMKTFTVREVDGGPAAVLDAADRDGEVRIKRRDGRTYALRPESSGRRITALPDFRARLTRIFPKPIPATQAAIVDRLIAGE